VKVGAGGKICFASSASTQGISPFFRPSAPRPMFAAQRSNTRRQCSALESNRSIFSCFDDYRANGTREYHLLGGRIANGVGYNVDVTVISREIQVVLSAEVRASKPKKSKTDDSTSHETTTSCDDVAVSDLK
jgi:hypothetical protein